MFLVDEIGQNSALSRYEINDDVIDINIGELFYEIMKYTVHYALKPRAPVVAAKWQTVQFIISNGIKNAGYTFEFSLRGTCQ